MQRINQSISLVTLLALVLLMTGCPNTTPDKIHEAKRDGAAASIAIGKTIKGLKILSDDHVITLTEEDAALNFLDKVNSPLLDAGKRLQGVNEATWGTVKGDVLAKLDVVLGGLNDAGSLVFKSDKAKEQFQVWVGTIRAAVMTFRATLETIK